jgi:hypothetical protein
VDIDGRRKRKSEEKGEKERRKEREKKKSKKADPIACRGTESL